MIRFPLLLCIFCCLVATCQTVHHEYLPGRTTGNLPHLNYGLGEDRLGGAKMTYLDTNLVVKVVDSVKDDYKVQLSNRHFAYLPKANFKADSLLQLQPYYLTGKWFVYGDSVYDYVTVEIDERLPFRSIQEVNPSKIIVDVFGATSNTNFIRQISTAREIKNAYYEQLEDDVFRIIIELNHPQHWGYSIYYEEKKLIIRVRRQPAQLSLANLKIAIDAGHGGTNVGAGGVTKPIAEKAYTLLLAKALENVLLEEKARVVMTRNKDTTLSIAERVQYLRLELPDVLVSIHLNSSDFDSIQGVGTFYRYIGFRPLSLFILNSVEELGLAEYGNVGSFNFGLNGPTDYPNCLVEVAFLSNRQDEKKILDPSFHKAVAIKIAEGIKKWLKSCE